MEAPMYYDMETCKIKVNEYLKMYPYIRRETNNLLYACMELHKIDNQIPPPRVWYGYPPNELYYVLGLDVALYRGCSKLKRKIVEMDECDDVDGKMCRMVE